MGFLKSIGITLKSLDSFSSSPPCFYSEMKCHYKRYDSGYPFFVLIEYWFIQCSFFPVKSRFYAAIGFRSGSIVAIGWLLRRNPTVSFLKKKMLIEYKKKSATIEVGRPQIKIIVKFPNHCVYLLLRLLLPWLLPLAASPPPINSV